jgi:hypothetical protein
LNKASTPEEMGECVAFLNQQTQRYSEGQTKRPETVGADPGLRAWESLVHVLLNHHDFVTVR